MTLSALVGTSIEKEARLELERLQGAWLTVSGRRQAELLVAGDHFAIKFFDGDIYMGIFDLDPGERPRAMDMRIEEGPVKHEGKIALCVYELEGDMLRWCPGEPGSEQRPTVFPPPDDSYRLSLVFRREQPQRRSR